MSYPSLQTPSGNSEVHIADGSVRLVGALFRTLGDVGRWNAAIDDRYLERIFKIDHTTDYQYLAGAMNAAALARKLNSGTKTYESYLSSPIQDQHGNLIEEPRIWDPPASMSEQAQTAWRAATEDLKTEWASTDDATSTLGQFHVLYAIDDGLQNSPCSIFHHSAGMTERADVAHFWVRMLDKSLGPAYTFTILDCSKSKQDWQYLQDKCALYRTLDSSD